ncbi:glutamate receptor ionotropic, kainate 2 [Octopus bimaculoides]|nr:glutamate receptor ionotropic, kainate 2 [Octopus bimaculoides]|eukprot:XP_014776235.1 PREDICTED: glutamate receptor ionotropic, kainate 2-like [Octopus bimaculoides]
MTSFVFYILTFCQILSFHRYIFACAFIPNCTSSSNILKLRIGLISVGQWMSTFQVYLIHNNTLKNCRIRPTYNKVMDEEYLRMPENGWRGIRLALLREIGTDEFETPLLIIGPYYANLAMILDEVNMPYIVTDEKGNHWADRSRTQDNIRWKNTIYIRPPAREQNKAVVDLFALKKWDGGVMIMPANKEDNYECQDLANQMLYAGKYLVKYTINTTSQDIMELRISSVIKNSLYMTQTRYIVCSPRESRHNLSQTFLNQAKDFSLLKDENRVFVFIDPTSSFEPLSGNNYFKMKLYAVKCKLFTFRYIKMDSFDMHPQNAVAKDVAEITRRALLTYAPHHKGNFNTAEFMQKLKSVVIEDGKTGWIAFNATGERKNYSLHLYQHSQDNKAIGIWTPDKNSSRERLTFIETNNSDSIRSKGLFAKTQIIMAVEERPFVFKTNGTNGNYTGFTIDLINELKRRLSFKYELKIVDSYGIKDPDGNWNGMIEAIRTNQADLGVGALSVTSERDKVVDFSLGIMTTGITILINRPRGTQHIFQFLVSFSAHLWLAIFGTVVGVSILFIILDYPNQERKFTVKETLWFSIGTLMTRGTDFSPNRTSQRILTAGYTFFVLVIVSTYTANLAAFLTMPSLEKPINSLEDLEVSSMPWGTVKDSNTMAVIRNMYPRLYDRLHESGVFLNATAAIENVNSSVFAFVFDYQIISHASMTYCDTVKVGTPVFIMEHGIAMKENALYKTKINIELLKMKEEGLIEKMNKRWWQDLNRCHKKSDKLRLEQFDVGHVAGAFIMLCGGLVCATAFFLFKKFYLKSKVLIAQQGIMVGKNRVFLSKVPK